jgi:hypothetical protein
VLASTERCPAAPSCDRFRAARRPEKEKEQREEYDEEEDDVICAEQLLELIVVQCSQVAARDVRGHPRDDPDLPAISARSSRDRPSRR